MPSTRGGGGNLHAEYQGGVKTFRVPIKEKYPTERFRSVPCSLLSGVGFECDFLSLSLPLSLSLRRGERERECVCVCERERWREGVPSEKRAASSRKRDISLRSCSRASSARLPFRVQGSGPNTIHMDSDLKYILKQRSSRRTTFISNIKAIVRLNQVHEHPRGSATSHSSAAPVPPPPACQQTGYEPDVSRALWWS